MYPKLVVGDLHVHERSPYLRKKELQVLLRKLRIIRSKKHCSSLLVVGDLLDRNAVLPVPTILELGNFFKLFEEVQLIVGNHDTPLKKVNGKTLLDIFTMVGAHIINEVTVIENDLFIPYYAPWDVEDKQKYYHVFMHKDIVELNRFNDEDFAMSLGKLPRAGMLFNGHLHGHTLVDLPNRPVCKLCQLGAPYPTSWSDSWEDNRYAFVIQRNGSYERIPLNITIDDTADPAGEVFALSRSRSTHKDNSEADMPTITMEDFVQDSVSFQKCLEMISADRITKKLVRGVIDRATTAAVDPMQF